MPEPMPRASSPPAMWPDTVPNPQADSLVITGPARAVATDMLAGPTRLRVRARTAPMQWGFVCYFTAAQMQTFETWYRLVARDYEGEFYARWIGGGRVVAFIEPYQYAPLGKGYQLTARVVRTRVDPSICDAHIEMVFGAIYRDELAAADVYRGDLAAADIYRDQFDLRLIEANEC